MRRSVQITWEVCFGLQAKNTQSRNSDSGNTTGSPQTVGSNRADDRQCETSLFSHPSLLWDGSWKGPKTQSAQAGGEMFSEEREPLPAGAEAMIWQIKYGALMILFGTVSPHILIEACLELTKGFLKDGVCSEK